MAFDPEWLISRLSLALQARRHLFEPSHRTAFRLFNGFLEGQPDLVVDVYGRTLVLYNYAEEPQSAVDMLHLAQTYLLERLHWVKAVVVKKRRGETLEERRGIVVYGDEPDRRVCEDGVWYAIDLLLSQDASLYLDTRNLRIWARQNLGGKTVLNTFAYTGSLGVAALAGGARRVVQLDLHKRYLNLAKASYALDGFPVHKADFLVGDFFPLVARLRRNRETFDCVFLDPPFFSETGKGRVDLVRHSQRLINKVRPLVEDGGWLVAINNALFVSGAEYIQALEDLCADGYLSIERLIPVPQDFTGYPETVCGQPPADPAPFNHSTKIAVLRVRRKQP